MRYKSSPDRFYELPPTQQKALMAETQEAVDPGKWVGYTMLGVGTLSAVLEVYYAIKDAVVGLELHNHSFARAYLEAASQDGRGALGGMALAAGGLVFVGVGKYLGNNFAYARANQLTAEQSEPEPGAEALYPIWDGEWPLDPRHLADPQPLLNESLL